MKKYLVNNVYIKAASANDAVKKYKLSDAAHFPDYVAIPSHSPDIMYQYINYISDAIKANNKRLANAYIDKLVSAYYDYDKLEDDFKRFINDYSKAMNDVHTKMRAFQSQVYQMKDSVKDSDKLKQMAYKFVQMGNYFDRANSARAREILAKEDDKKYPEFYNFALQVYQQLKMEVDGAKKNATLKPYRLWHDNQTITMLDDGANRLYWIASERRDNKGELLSKKILKLTDEYKNATYDSVKDSWLNVRGTTSQGYEVRAIYNGRSGRLYAVIYRPRTNDFLVAAGYNQQRGDWDQGYYDFKSEDQARKFAEKHARQMGDSVEDAPDMETISGRQSYYLQQIMAAIDILDPRMWNHAGTKVNVDNNNITLLATSDGIKIINAKTGKTIIAKSKEEVEKYLRQNVN